MRKVDEIQQYVLNILKTTVIGAGTTSDLLDRNGVIGIHTPEDPNGFEAFAKISRVLETQKILPLTFDFWKASSYRFDALDKKTAECCMDFYQILSCTSGVMRLFDEEKIGCVLLKGISIAKLYPGPEYRKSSDVDILLADRNDAERACELLEKNGFVRDSEPHSLHHIEFMSPGNVLLELHTEMAEPFDNENANRLLNELAAAGCGRRKEFVYAGESTYIYDSAALGLSIVIHGLQHFMRKGMGIKMLLDWAVFLQNEDFDEKVAGELKGYLNKLKIGGFADALTRLSCCYLGVDISRASMLCDDCHSPLKDWEEAFLVDMFEGGEFGKAGDDRMVNLRGTGFWDYFREFHHQMHLNFPVAGRVFLIWPVLWAVTLVRFLVNNRKLRGIKTGDILKNAGERGKIAAGMRLFE